MKILSPQSSKSRIVKVAIDGNGSAITAGALLTQGVTDGQDFGAFIISGAAAADAFGILLNAHATANDSTIETGVTRTLADVEMLAPGDLVAVEYDQTDTAAIASGSTTTGVITSSDTETGCWHYMVAGTGIGQLAYIKSYSSDTSTYKSALTTAPDNTTTVIRILAPGRILAKLNTARTKLGTDAGDGSADFFVLRNEMSYNGQDWIELDYTLHHNLQLNGKSPVFRAIGFFRDLASSPIA